MHAIITTYGWNQRNPLWLVFKLFIINLWISLNHCVDLFSMFISGNWATYGTEWHRTWGRPNLLSFTLYVLEMYFGTSFVCKNSDKIMNDNLSFKNVSFESFSIIVTVNHEVIPQISFRCYIWKMGVLHARKRVTFSGPQKRKPHSSKWKSW